MNNERFPHPNGHPHDDDLQPERWADAPSSDADALDALLNEIAQGNGIPNLRSGHSHQRPDIRTDAGGADALHAATRAFHRRFEAAQHRDPGSTALDPYLWEQIVTATTQQAWRAQGSLWRDAARNALSPGIPSQSRNHVTTRRPIQRWAPVANATLALVILLAGFGVWRVYDGLNGSGPADPEPMTPGIAMQPASPEATELPAVEAPLADTPAPITACDFSADIPLFPDVDESPIDGTALLLTTSGDLALTCPEEPEPIVLASGIDHASPLGWPGAVFTLSGGDDLAAQVPSVVNVINGESIEIGIQPEGVQYQLKYDIASPWLVAPAARNPDDWAITDLRTMESRLLSEYAASSISPGIGVMTSANADGTIVIGLWTPNDEDGDGALLEGVDLPGSVLVLDGSLDAPRWIGLPDDLPRITEMLLSSDGRHLALKATEAGELPTGNTTYSIVRASDGTEVVRPVTFEDPMSTMRWIQESRAFAFTANTSLHVLSVDPAQVPTTMLERTTDTLGNLETTYDPEVVIVHRMANEELATEIPLGIEQRLFSVNTATGDVIEINGFDASHNTSPWIQETRFLVMYEPQIDQPETTTYQVIDAVSGEVIDELVDVPRATFPPDQFGLGRRSVASTDDGNTEVIAFGTQHIYLMRLEAGEPVVRRLPPPPKFGTEFNGSVDLFISPDGSMVSFTLNGDESRTRWLLPLDGEPDDWIEIPSTVPGEGPAYIFFVPGTGD